MNVTDVVCEVRLGDVTRRGRGAAQSWWPVISRPAATETGHPPVNGFHPSLTALCPHIVKNSSQFQGDGGEVGAGEGVDLVDQCGLSASAG